MTTQKQKRDLLSTAAVFAAILLVAAVLMFLGTRNDAVSKADSLKGGIVTAHQVRLAFQSVSGRIVDRPFQESDRVKTGDVLMRIDPADVDLAVRSLEAQIKSLEAQIAYEKGAIVNNLETAATTEASTWRQIEEAETVRRSAAASLENASREWKRVQKLAPAGAVSQSAYDQAKSAYINARSSLEAAERSIDSMSVGATPEQKNRLKRTGKAEGMRLSTIENLRADARNRQNTVDNLTASKEQLSVSLEEQLLYRSRLQLQAPEAGKIIEFLFEPGDIISASAPALLLETERRYVDVYVSETQAPKFAPGTEVSVFSPALNKNFKAVVRLCEAAPDFATLRMVRERGQADLTLFKVRLDLPADSEKDGLLTGMTLEVRA